MTDAPRPNPRVRENWLQTRAEFEQHEADVRARRLAAQRSAEARENLARAYDAFPLFPAASVRARSLRTKYLAATETTGEYRRPHQFACEDGGERGFMYASIPGVIVGLWIIIGTFLAPYSFVATIIWILVQLFVWFVIWMYACAMPLATWMSARAGEHYDTIVEDYNAYARWVASIDQE